jgi:hypothetical protein
MFLQGDQKEVASQLHRIEERGSILDTLLQQTESFSRSLGQNDRQRLDQYFTSVREVEERVRRRESPTTTEPGTGTVRPTPQLRPAALLELEEQLSGLLDTRVQISTGAKRGRLTVEFANLEDLERIYRVILDGREDLD